MKQKEKLSPLNKLKAFFWPVYHHEYGKIVPMLLIAFLISFSYNILRTTKDSLIVTAQGSGAEVIPFIKVWVLLPTVIIMVFILTKLSNIMSRERVFYIMVSSFLLFFFIFIFVLYPARATLHPHTTANYLESIFPAGFKGFIAIFRNWTFSCYYVMSELWGNIILSVLFWGFVNEVSNVKQAKRFYGLLGLSLNIAGTLSGQVSVFFSRCVFKYKLPFGSDPWEQTLTMIIATVLICGITIMILFRWMNKHSIKDGHQDPPLQKSSRKQSPMSIRQMISFLANNRYLLYIAIVVLSYNLVINLVEVIWKGELKQLYPTPNDYNTHMSYVSTAMGLMATFISLFVSRQVLQRFGWTSTALITPIILIFASIGFFSLLFMHEYAHDLAYSLIGISPLYLAVIFGSFHNSICRASKYTVFDTTKEMAFIPLSKEEKRKGKAAIDGIGSRLGKSGGSLIHQGLFMIFANLTASAPYVGVIVIAAITIWIITIKGLGKQFNTLSAKQETLSTIQNENEKASQTAEIQESKKAGIVV